MSHSMKPRYEVGYKLSGFGRYGWIFDSGTDDLKVAGKRVLALRAIGRDAHVQDRITGLAVPEEAYTMYSGRKR
jgi:hypothetical protein